jgi:hypothetical protein
MDSEDWAVASLVHVLAADHDTDPPQHPDLAASSLRNLPGEGRSRWHQGDA